MGSMLCDGKEESMQSSNIIAMPTFVEVIPNISTIRGEKKKETFPCIACSAMSTFSFPSRLAHQAHVRSS